MKSEANLFPAFPESREPDINVLTTVWDEAPEFELLPPWDEQQQCRKILNRLQAAAQAKAGALVVFEPGRQRYLFRAAAGLACTESAICNLIWSHVGKFQAGPEHEGQPTTYSRHALSQQPLFDFERHLGFLSYCFQPLTVDQKVIGGALLGNREPGVDFTARDLRRLAQAALLASGDLERIRLYKELKGLFIHSVHAFVSAIDAKDPYTHGHSERVTDYALKIGRVLEWAPEMLEALRMSAILHDVGKIGVSEVILSKPSALTSDEFSQIKRHPEIGAKIVGEIPQLKATLSGILFHHERFDGQGYPRGLEGENIPVFGRLISVADAYDAMTSDRPYRHGLKKEKALQELLDHRGTQFDARMVTAFLQAHEQGAIL
jgi:HD-GYP domain-containing protein (c-di-GMP phosphodiesterase class II)